MAGDRQPRKRNRNDPSGIENKGKRAEPDGHDPERDPGRTLDGIGRGSSRDRMGSEQFRPQQDIGGHGEQDYRDVGRGQPGGAYEHSGRRDYRHGSGYGGFGESPGESGGGFDSGRSYAAEPGWGPSYGQHGNDAEQGQQRAPGNPRRHGGGPKGNSRVGAGGRGK